ncbi:MAG: hypothetical protein J5623_00295 [Clostridiales bacterium]|nr:hypothetical protein [Clostridiales bacterium]
MASWVEAYDFADIVLSNSLYMWLVYISFFILALIVRKKDDKTRRITGNVMIASSVPGLLISVFCLGLFLYAMITYHNMMASGKFKSIYDSPELTKLFHTCNGLPVDLLLFSVAIFSILAITAIVCGIIIIRRSPKKAAGIITLIYGSNLIAFIMFVTSAVVMVLADS